VKLIASRAAQADLERLQIVILGIWHGREERE
jgi:hypothetical protein